MNRRVGALNKQSNIHTLNRGCTERRSGFTVVELLIVIVVIAILAVITIVAFNGIQQRAKDTSVQADVANAIKKLETLKSQHPTEQYPASLSEAGLSASGGNTYYYQYSSNDNSYCLQSSNGPIEYYASSVQKSVSKGYCGSDSMVAWWPFNNSANDQTTSGLNGTLTSATVTPATGQNGQANTAYALTGSSSSIDFGNSTKFNQSELTMSAWINTNATGISQTIMAKEGKYKYRLISGNVQVLAASSTGWTHTPSCAYSYTTGTWFTSLWRLVHSQAVLKYM